MKKIIKKLTSIVAMLVLILLSNQNVYAAQENELYLIDVDNVAEFLDNSTTTQVITSSEIDLLNQLVEDNVIEEKMLNEQLLKLSNETEQNLSRIGYTEDQIKIIQNYDGESNSLAYTSSALASSRSSDSTVTFRYGLAGSNTMKEVLIAYDITWSGCPFFCLTDSFGIGWIAADSNSNEIVTETTNAIGRADYFTVDGTQQTAYRDISMNTYTNGIVTGNPIMGSANGSYAKHISGIINVQTQSETYTMKTIQIFIAYAHTTAFIDASSNITIAWKKVSGAISFSPRTKQTMMVQDHHKFFYNSQDVITAE